ncbi:MAG: hypothetical protein JRJ19_10335, partial [Deltaproteobacteria bacterium]|nr:hypothetical protein [Deltaproteobacteria bacterium]
ENSNTSLRPILQITYEEGAGPDGGPEEDGGLDAGPDGGPEEDGGLDAGPDGGPEDDAGPGDDGPQADGGGEPESGGGCSCGKQETSSSLPAIVLLMGMVGLVIRRKY